MMVSQYHPSRLFLFILLPLWLAACTTSSRAGMEEQPWLDEPEGQAECLTDVDCRVGERCSAGACVLVARPPVTDPDEDQQLCRDDLDCPDGAACLGGTCAAPEPIGEGEDEGQDEPEGADPEGTAEGEGEGQRVPSGEGEGEGTAEVVCRPDGLEPNDLPAEALNLTLEEARLLEGLSLCSEDEDWFRLRLTANNRIVITVTGGALQVELRAPDGAAVVAQSIPTNNGAQAARDRLPGDASYLIRVWGRPTDRYALQVEVEGPPPIECEADRFEPNETAVQAKDLNGLGASLSLCDDDVDWLRLTCAEGDSVAVTVEGQAGLQVELRDAAGAAVLGRSTPLANGAQARGADLQAGHYLVRVSGVQTLAYQLAIQITPGEGPVVPEPENPPQACVDDRYEQNDSMRQANAALMADGYTDGLIYCPQDDDYYQFHLTAGSYFTADLDFEMWKDLDLYLLDEDGWELASSVNPNLIFAWESIEYTAPREMDVYLLISSIWPTVHSSYSLNLGLIPGEEPGHDDCQDEFEPNGSSATASPIVAGRYDAAICPAIEDWYVVELRRAGPLEVELLLDPSTGDLDLEVLDRRVQRIDRSLAGIDGEDEYLYLDIEEPGLVYIRVYGYEPDDAGAYTLDVWF